MQQPFDKVVFPIFCHYDSSYLSIVSIFIFQFLIKVISELLLGPINLTQSIHLKPLSESVVNHEKNGWKNDNSDSK